MKTKRQVLRRLLNCKERLLRICILAFQRLRKTHQRLTQKVRHSNSDCGVAVIYFPCDGSGLSCADQFERIMPQLGPGYQLTVIQLPQKIEFEQDQNLTQSCEATIEFPEEPMLE